jgi:hypothetical protein
VQLHCSVFSLAKLSAGLISNIFDVLDLEYHDQINIELYKQDSCQPSQFCDIIASGTLRL